MTFNVTILGCGSAMPTGKRHPAAHVLNAHEQFYLIDCGEGTQMQLWKYGINPHKINHIFISHLHGDHVYGLFGLISTLGLLGRERTLYIYGVKMLGEVLENHQRLFDTKLPYQIEFVEVDPKVSALVYENKVMEVYTVPLKHRVPACGYLFREKTPELNVDKFAIERYGLTLRQIVAAKRGEDLEDESGGVIPNSAITYRPYRPRAYAYCSDTMPSAKVVKAVCGVDLLYHEATFGDDEQPTAKATGHSTARGAAKVAREANVGRLVIGHFSARYKDAGVLLAEAREVFEGTELAEEGRCFEIKHP